MFNTIQNVKTTFGTTVVTPSQAQIQALNKFNEYFGMIATTVYDSVAPEFREWALQSLLQAKGAVETSVQHGWKSPNY